LQLRRSTRRWPWPASSLQALACPCRPRPSSGWPAGSVILAVCAPILRRIVREIGG
jgi:hypothetical protein